MAAEAQNKPANQGKIDSNIKFAHSSQVKEKILDQEQFKEASENQGIINKDFSFLKKDIDAEQKLNQPRSKEYLVALDMIDFLSSRDETIIEKLRLEKGDEFVEEIQEMSDEEIYAMITDTFHEQFAEIEKEISDNLIVVLSKCYITGCDCHAIDSEGHIIEHYQENKQLPEEYEFGRSVYHSRWNDNCACIEVYHYCCRVISFDGSVEVVKKGML